MPILLPMYFDSNEKFKIIEKYNRKLLINDFDCLEQLSNLRYNHIKFVPINEYYEYEIFSQFKDFTLIFDEKDDISIPTEKPTNSFVDSFISIQYKQLTNANLDSTLDHFYYKKSLGIWQHFKGVVPTTNTHRVFLPSPDFVKLNDQFGYFPVCNVNVYVVTKHSIYGPSSVEYPKFQVIPIDTLSSSLVCGVAKIFSKLKVPIKQYKIYNKELKITHCLFEGSAYDFYIFTGSGSSNSKIIPILDHLKNLNLSKKTNVV